MIDAIPNPGTQEATKRGCTCATIDNGHGRGYHWYEGQKVPQFVITGSCPLHDPKGEIR